MIQTNHLISWLLIGILFVVLYCSSPHLHYRAAASHRNTSVRLQSHTVPDDDDAAQQLKRHKKTPKSHGLQKEPEKVVRFSDLLHEPVSCEVPSVSHNFGIWKNVTSALSHGYYLFVATKNNHVNSDTVESLLHNTSAVCSFSGLYDARKIFQLSQRSHPFLYTPPKRKRLSPFRFFPILFIGTSHMRYLSAEFCAWFSFSNFRSQSNQSHKEEAATRAFCFDLIFKKTVIIHLFSDGSFIHLNGTDVVEFQNRVLSLLLSRKIHRQQSGSKIHRTETLPLESDVENLLELVASSPTILQKLAERADIQVLLSRRQGLINGTSAAATKSSSSLSKSPAVHIATYVKSLFNLERLRLNAALISLQVVQIMMLGRITDNASANRSVPTSVTERFLYFTNFPMVGHFKNFQVTDDERTQNEEWKSIFEDVNPSPAPTHQVERKKAVVRRSPMTVVPFRHVVYARGGWDLLYNNTEPAWLTAMLKKDLKYISSLLLKASTLLQYASYFQDMKNVQLSRKTLNGDNDASLGYFIHVMSPHAVNKPKRGQGISKKTREWYQECNALPRLQQYIAATIRAVSSVNQQLSSVRDRGSSHSRNISRENAKMKGTAVSNEMLVRYVNVAPIVSAAVDFTNRWSDASGLHYLGPVLRGMLDRVLGSFIVSELHAALPPHVKSRQENELLGTTVSALQQEINRLVLTKENHDDGASTVLKDVSSAKNLINQTVASPRPTQLISLFRSSKLCPEAFDCMLNPKSIKLNATAKKCNEIFDLWYIERSLGNLPNL